MEFGRGLNPIIRWFYICGLSSYPSYNFLFTETNKKHFLYYVPTFGLVALTISCGNFAYIESPMVFNRPILRYSFDLYVFVPVFTTVFYAIQMIFVSRYFGTIWSQIDTFERLSQTKFSLDPIEYRRHFIRRVDIILATLILPFVNGFLGLQVETVPLTIARAILRVLTLLPLCQSIFYIGLLDYLLQCFARHLKMRAAIVELPIDVLTNYVRSFPVIDLKTELSQYKQLHLELWKLTAHINKLFDWTNVAIFLQNCFFSVFYAYHVSAMIMDQFHITNILRKPKNKCRTYSIIC